MMYGLENESFTQIIKILSQHEEILSAVLYGSRAKGSYKKGSDIDISLKGNIPLTLLNQISLELDALYTPNRIDLSVYNEIKNESLKNHIDTVGIIIYHSPTDIRNKGAK